jgi:hypothetical protein
VPGQTADEKRGQERGGQNWHQPFHHAMSGWPTIDSRALIRISTAIMASTTRAILANGSAANDDGDNHVHQGFATNDCEGRIHLRISTVATAPVLDSHITETVPRQ